MKKCMECDIELRANQQKSFTCGSKKCLNDRKKRLYREAKENKVFPVIDLELDTKCCKKCNKTKSYKFFSKDCSTKDGFQVYCKDCKRESNIAAYYFYNPKVEIFCARCNINLGFVSKSTIHCPECSSIVTAEIRKQKTKERRAANPALCRETVNAWRKKNPDKVKLYAKRSYARSRGIEVEPLPSQLNKYESVKKKRPKNLVIKETNLKLQKFWKAKGLI